MLNLHEFYLVAYASIDWHDFVVVETVEFTAEDEKMNLPPPMSLSELENMSLAQRRMASLSAMEDHEIPDFAAYVSSCMITGNSTIVLTGIWPLSLCLFVGVWCK